MLDDMRKAGDAAASAQRAADEAAARQRAQEHLQHLGLGPAHAPAQPPLQGQQQMPQYGSGPQQLPQYGSGPHPLPNQARPCSASALPSDYFSFGNTPPVMSLPRGEVKGRSLSLSLQGQQFGGGAPTAFNTPAPSAAPPQQYPPPPQV
jgi:hypothetical protein